MRWIKSTWDKRSTESLKLYEESEDQEAHWEAIRLIFDPWGLFTEVNVECSPRMGEMMQDRPMVHRYFGPSPPTSLLMCFIYSYVLNY